MFAVAKGGEELACIEPKGAGRGAKEIQRKTEIVLNIPILAKIKLAGVSIILYLCRMGRKKDSKYEGAYSLYLSGLSLEQVAKKIGVSRQSVYKAFKDRGFTLRGPNFQPFQEYDGKKFTLRNHGYYSLTTGNRCLMHRYVWEKERGRIPKGFDIHHINEVKADNRIENLECLPKSEHTRKYSPSNNQFGKGKRPVESISENGTVTKYAHTTEAAKQIGVSRTAITQAINGRTKTCKGKKWRYADN